MGATASASVSVSVLAFRWLRLPKSYSPVNEDLRHSLGKCGLVVCGLEFSETIEPHPDSTQALGSGCLFGRDPLPLTPATH